MPDNASSLMCSSCKASSPLLAFLRDLRAFEAGAHGSAVLLAAPAVAGSSSGPEYRRDYGRRDEDQPIYPLHVPNACQECKSTHVLFMLKPIPYTVLASWAKSSAEQ